MLPSGSSHPNSGKELCQVMGSVASARKVLKQVLASQRRIDQESTSYQPKLIQEAFVVHHH